jgi:hypothetical protein
MYIMENNDKLCFGFQINSLAMQAKTRRHTTVPYSVQIWRTITINGVGAVTETGAWL